MIIIPLPVVEFLPIKHTHMIVTSIYPHLGMFNSLSTQDFRWQSINLSRSNPN
jgi:hypothetical protein